MVFLLSSFPLAAPAETLIASLAGDGTVLARADVPEGAGWCILWRHSVQGFEVADCYLNRTGQMVLHRAHLPDFAAGLDHIPGRGVQRSDGAGGYWIEALDEPVPGNTYILRPGSMEVNHRISIGGNVISLSAMAAHQRVRMALEPDGN
ncbi:DUF1850 domain-containing protein [Tropicimonas sp.]|uniref:DUF1850 domain-containing protein n=1 Tax=Tropicimonas sp. TaxID=2067044 RepID=UPI003A879466